MVKIPLSSNTVKSVELGGILILLMAHILDSHNAVEPPFRTFQLLALCESNNQFYFELIENYMVAIKSFIKKGDRCRTCQCKNRYLTYKAFFD